MTAPSKPWESSMNNQDTSFLLNGGTEGGVNSNPGPMSGLRVMRGGGGQMSGVPPLPPRTSARGGMYSTGGGLMSRFPYSTGYGGMYGGAYGGTYGGYGGAYGYSPYGMRPPNSDFENRYVQLAEESAAPAFESIDNFVRGFSSVTMMLESTFQAMHMSFRAILGVAENMSRMRTAIFEFLSAFAILKTIYLFYRKVLYFLGLVNGADVSWKEAEAAVVGKTVSRKPHWPFLAFLATIVVGPTLVYRYLLSQDLPPEEDIEVVATYDFDGDQGELSFRKGERMIVKPSAIKKGWIMATKGTSKGLVPYNRIAILKKRPVFPSSEVPPAPPITQIPSEQQPLVNSQEHTKDKEDYS